MVNDPVLEYSLIASGPTLFHLFLSSIAHAASLYNFIHESGHDLERILDSIFKQSFMTTS